MAKKTRKETDAEIDAQIDEYLAPLEELGSKDLPAVARYLALKMYVLQVGIETIRADVAKLAACVARTNHVTSKAPSKRTKRPPAAAESE